jgi:D-alanyl-lipoteichoic acid acyltransferase DltB (MBOAT superfamily)
MLPEAADFAARVANLRSILFTAFTLVGLALAAVLAVAAGRIRADARERLVVAVSLAVLLWFAGMPATLAFVAWTVAFGLAVELGVEMRALRAVAVALLVVFVVAPVLAVGALAQPRHAREFVAFATNMALLRFVAWARGRWRGEIPRASAERTFRAFVFFPTFVNGPVERAPELTAPLGPPAVAPGLARIGIGVAKIAAVALLLPPRWTAVLSQGPEAAWLQLWLWAILLYVWFYLSFSAWSDVAIGLGLVCGRQVRENFDRPWDATDPADFWRRWHVSFGVWLRDQVYVPLGGNRRHRAANVVAVFLVSAAWHVWGTLKILGLGYYPPRQWLGFFLWGALHAVAVILWPRGAHEHVTLARAATFLFAAFAWVPFFIPGDVSWPGLGRMLARMLLPFV